MLTRVFFSKNIMLLYFGVSGGGLGVFWMIWEGSRTSISDFSPKYRKFAFYNVIFKIFESFRVKVCSLCQEKSNKSL